MNNNNPTDISTLTEEEAYNHGREFLKYVEENIDQLKHNLKKNITYNPEYFDAAINETVIKIYNRITKGRHRINDFKNYFFLSSKNTYILYDNKWKKERNQFTDDLTLADTFEEEDIKEKKLQAVEKLFDFIYKRLEEVFEPLEVDVFIIYYKLKTGTTRISYKKIANITNLTTSFVVQTIQKLRDFTTTDELILNYKRKLEDDYID